MPWFNDPMVDVVLKTSWEKEKMLVAIIFYCFNNVYYLLKDSWPLFEVPGNVRFFGIGGMRVNNIPQQTLSELLQFKPETVVIQLGGNDISAASSPNQIYEKLMELTVYLKDNGINNVCVVEIVKRTTTRCPNNQCQQAFAISFYTSAKLNFTEAKKLCESRSGSLLHIRNQMEMTFVKHQIRYQKLNSATYSNFWLGLKDQTQLGLFRWVDDNSSLSYSNWSAHEPRSLNGQESCAVLDRVYYYKWRSRSCSRKAWPICAQRLNFCPEHN